MELSKGGNQNQQSV